MDLTAIQSAIASLKVATQVTKTLLDLKVDSEVQAKVSELQGALLEAQTAALAATTSQFELQERIRELEKEVRELSAWKLKEDQYALVSPWRGPAQAYALKEKASKGEAPHLLCANCFHSARKVILNPLNKDGRALLTCPSCKATLETGYRRIGSPKYAEQYLKDEE